VAKIAQGLKDKVLKRSLFCKIYPKEKKKKRKKEPLVFEFGAIIFLG
jgi:hypothetical protein